MLIFAVIGFILSLSASLSLVGFVLCIISRVRLKRYVRTYGVADGKASTGKYLGIAGIIIGVINIILVIFAVAIAVASMLNGGLDLGAYGEMFEASDIDF